MWSSTGPIFMGLVMKGLRDYYKRFTLNSTRAPYVHTTTITIIIVMNVMDDK